MRSFNQQTDALHSQTHEGAYIEHVTYSHPSVEREPRIMARVINAQQLALTYGGLMTRLTCQQYFIITAPGCSAMDAGIPSPHKLCANKQTFR